MARALLPCAILLLLSSCALAARIPSHTVFPSTRRLLHAGHQDESANEEAADSTSYLESLQTQGTTLTGRLDQLMNTDSATGLNEDAVNTLMQDVQGDAEATTAADTSLTADNIIDTYGSEDGTLNATATSTAALAILACKADSNCQLAVTSSTAVEAATDSGDNVNWLKWTGAAVLFVEALIGLCVPFFLKLHFSFMQGWFLSALNCFAGGVFLTFGFMHLLPDAVSSTPDSVSDDFPMAYFFAALGFYVLFLVQKVISPLLGGKAHVQDASACSCTGACCAGKLPTHQVTPNPAYTVSNDKLTQPIASDTSSISVPCKNCGCDRDPSPETAALTAAPVAAAHKSYQGMTWRSWIAPVFLAAGVCVHAVLEGLALGLQRDKAGAVTVLVAMVSHKWVESVALSSITVKNGGGFKEVLCCLLPFAACFFLGTGIGVGVGRDENPWVDIVLFGLIAGAFIFVGGYELIATEFTNSANNGRSRFRRVGLFLPVLAGFTLVALLQLVHGG